MFLMPVMYYLYAEVYYQYHIKIQFLKGIEFANYIMQLDQWSSEILVKVILAYQLQLASEILWYAISNSRSKVIKCFIYKIFHIHIYMNAWNKIISYH